MKYTQCMLLSNKTSAVVYDGPYYAKAAQSNQATRALVSIHECVSA